MEFTTNDTDAGLGRMYRVGEQWFGSWDPDTERVTGSRLELYIESYAILKLTPKGKWIECPGYAGNKRFILNEAWRRFAHETKEEALEAFKARRERQILILEGQVKRARLALTAASNTDVAALNCFE